MLIAVWFYASAFVTRPGDEMPAEKRRRPCSTVAVAIRPAVRNHGVPLRSTSVEYAACAVNRYHYYQPSQQNHCLPALFDDCRNI